MPICNHNLSDLAVEHVQSEPGMAHFAGTGPRDKKCGQCIFFGYSKIIRKELVNKETGEVYNVTKNHEGCKKYFILTEKHGTKISPKLLSCKYFEDKDKNKDIAQ
jgi:hypothetical protein